VLLLCYFVLCEIQEVRHAKSVMAYLKSGWNLFDIGNLIIFWIIVIYDIVFLSNLPLNSINLQSTGFVRLEQTAEIYTQLFNVQAFNILVTFIKTFKFLQMNDRMSLLWKTLGKASGDLSAFFHLFYHCVYGLFINGPYLVWPNNS